VSVPGHVSEPRPLRASLLLLSIPAFAAQLRPVPEEYVTAGGDEDAARVVVCPCGAWTVVPFAELVSCEGECERVFFHGRSVYVAGGPKAQEHLSASAGLSQTPSDA
jgi:hypothetical protein